MTAKTQHPKDEIESKTIDVCEIQDTLCDDRQDVRWDAVCREASDIIMGYLDSIREREKRLLVLRFGLIDGIPRTLAELGEEMKLSTERVRQIQSTALTKLRSQKSALLRDLHDDLGGPFLNKEHHRWHS